MSRHTFHDLNTVVDELHALVDDWAQAGAFEPDVDADGMEVLRLVLHEWVANLVQHAVFPGAVEIALDVEREPGGAMCTLEDSSAGFDFLAQLDQQRSVLDGPGPSERGRGLLMLVTCTEDLGFVAASGGTRQRITFHVRPPVPAHTVLSGLFRPDDLLGDDVPGDALPDAGDAPLAPSAGAGALPIAGLPPRSSRGDGAPPHPAAPPSR